jgi:putative acetyltransferase
MFYKEIFSIKNFPSQKNLQNRKRKKMPTITIIRTDSGSADFRELVRLLDLELAERDGDEHAYYAQFNKIDKISQVVVAYEGDQAVGCGAFKKFSRGAAEIKRMYIREQARGRGIAGLILDELERWARELNYTECVLETGLKQPEAIALYRKKGYHTIPNYGQYEGMENSVCMRKVIK